MKKLEMKEKKTLNKYWIDERIKNVWLFENLYELTKKK